MTLNQVISLIKQIGESHEQINTVNFGSLIDNLNSDVVYPLMSFELVQSNIKGSTINIGLSMFFLDRVLAEGLNTEDVLSDQLQICQDIIATLRYPDVEFVISENVDILFVEDTTPDLLAGVKADFELELPYASNRCVIPTTFEYPDQPDYDYSEVYPVPNTQGNFLKINDQ